MALVETIEHGSGEGRCSPRARWPFSEPEPQWYRDQAERWQKLEDAGWQFRRAGHPLAEQISIEMVGPNRRAAIFRVDRFQSKEAIHTQLLGLCEMFHSASA